MTDCGEDSNSFEMDGMDDFVLSILSFMDDDEMDSGVETSFSQSTCSDTEKSVYEISRISSPLKVSWSPSSGCICSTEEAAKPPTPPRQRTTCSDQSSYSRVSESSFLADRPNATSTPRKTRQEPLSLNELKRLLEDVERSQTRQEEQPAREEVTRHHVRDSGATGQPARYCKFCFKNGESAKVYGSHYTKKQDGTVSCPILRRYVCDLCGATGDEAHTRRYCKLNPKPAVPLPPYRKLSNGFVTSYYTHK